MILPLLAALVLTQAPDAPVAAPASGAVVADASSGMPADDFGMVAWCQGALTGHMELFPTVRPELARVESEKAERLNAKLTGDALKAARARQAAELKESAAGDLAQMKAGRDYLALYKSALDTSEASGPADLHRRREAAAADGYRIWSAARAANDRDRMWSWLMWELPARCETAARRLKADAGLFAGAYKADAAPASAPAPATSDTPPPAPAADPAAAAPPPAG